MSWTKGLNVKIGADVTEFENSIRKINSQTKSLTTELRGINQSLKFDTKNPTLLAQKQQILNERYTATNKKLGELKTVNQTLNDEYKKGNVSLEDYNEQMRIQGNEIAITESRLVGFSEEIRANGRELTKYSGKSGQVVAGLEDFSGKAESASRSMAKYSLAATALLGGMAKSAMDFESSFAGVQKVMSDDITPKQLEEIRKGIINMSKEVPAGTTAISEVAAAAGQLGIKTENILDFTKVMIDMGESTNLSADSAATSLARFANITGMSQKDFDRLGSTIVQLGNNFATTESEIVEMGMRLAGAGTQIGMTEAEIMALATALSSVGIEAQAGGSAFSKVMVNMQLAVETGSESLNDFASVAGMSAEQFASAFKKDATGALLAFVEGLGDLGDEGDSAIKVLDDMGIKEVRLRDSLLRAAGASDIFSDAIRMGSKAWEDNTALTDEANVRYETTEAKLQMLKNQFVAVGIQLGEHLLPHIQNFVDWLGKLVGKFGEMDEGTQKFILSLVGVTAVAAPAIGAIGKLAKGTSQIITVAKLAGTSLGIFGTATAGAGGAAATGAVGVAGLAGSFGAVATAAVPFVAVGAAVVGTGIVINKAMSEEAVPAIDLFGSSVEYNVGLVSDEFGDLVQGMESTTVEIGEQTEQMVGKYIAMSDNIQLENLKMFVGLTEGTAENIEKLKQMNEEATAYAIEQGEINKNEEIARYQEIFDNSTTITQAQKDMILQYTEEEYQGRTETMIKLQEELTSIYDAIANQGGEATKSQKDRINEIQNEQRDKSISLLAETEKEAKVIQNRMSQYGERMSAEQASEVVKEYNRMRDESIKASEEQRDATVRLAEEMRAKNPEKFGAMADDMIREANKMNTDVTSAMETLRVQGLMKLESEYGTLAKDINLNSGELATWKDKMFNVNRDWNSLSFKDKKTTITTEHRDIYTSYGNKSKHNNGLRSVPYDGYSPYLHKGERVLKKYEAEQLDRQGYLNSSRNKMSDNTNSLVNNVDNSTINNNTTISGVYHIREEADIEKLANAFTREAERKRR